MGKYTQSIYSYLKSIDLNPFNDRDLIEGAKSLGMFYYDGIPEPIMDKLFVKFMRNYMRNEMVWLSVDEFRLDLINYMTQREGWYTQMFDVYKNLLPFEMTQMTSDTTTDQLNDSETMNDRNTQSNTQNTTDNNTLSDTSQSSNTISETINNESSTRDVTTDEKSSGLSTTTGEDITTSKDVGVVNGSTVSDNSVNINKDTTETTTGRKAQGFGSITDFDESGAMIDGTDFDESETKSSGGDETTTNTTSTVNDTTTTDGDSKTNRNDTTENTDSLLGNNSESTIGENIGTDTTTVTGESNQTSESVTLSTSESDLTESGTNKTIGSQTGNQTTITEGKVEWKPALARKFYEHYVNVDGEWIKGSRDLFLMIY